MLVKVKTEGEHKHLYSPSVLTFTSTCVHPLFYPSQAPVFTPCFTLHKHLCSPPVLPFTSTCVHPLFLVRSMLLIFIVFCCCWFFFVLCSILPVSLDCPFWIVPSVFSYVDLLLICNNFLKQKVRSFM